MSKPPTTILFKMTGCGHCETLKSDWNQAVKEISQHNKISSVDGYNTIKGGKQHVEVVDAHNETKKENLGKKYNGGKPFSVNGYPTIKRCSKQGTIEYNGPRTKDALKNFIVTGKTMVAVGGGKKRTKKQKNGNKNTRKNRGQKSLGSWWNKLF